MLSCYRHENIISLLGFSHGRDEMILAYEYASRGSLDGHLKDVTLTWTQRIKICLDAAKGLYYLHDPKDQYQRLIHCDIKSANILLDENFKAKVSDFGLSKIGPANQQNSMLVTSALGTPGYCDPVFIDTYTLTKESDVYSFGVVLFEVLCGKLCVEYSKGQLKEIHVRMWKQSYKEKKLDTIVFQGLIQQMDLDSLETFADIAYECLKRSREERPTMSLVVEKLQESLALQELHNLELLKEYEEIVNAAVPPLNYKSSDELKVLLTKGFRVDKGKMWFSKSEKGEHYGMIPIQDCLIQDDPSRDYSDQYSFEKNSRFEVGCYKTHLMEFKLRVRTPLFLSPGVTYGLNLVFHNSEREKMKQLVGVRYQLQGETKISILRFADKREDKQLVAELYQFTSNEEGIQDLEISLEDCGLLGDFYIEGIEFQPLERVEHPVVVTNEEIVRAVVPPLFYGFTEVSEVLLSQGVFLNKGRTWLSINDKGELCVLISIEECLIQDDPNTSYSGNFLLQKDSRFGICCYKADKMNFKLRVRTPLFLSPDVTYGLNLVFHYSHSETENMKIQHVGVRYKFQGETKVSVLHFEDKKEDKRLVTRLYQFNSTEECISDFEILLEDCGFPSDFYIEGIEFQPLKNVDCPVVVANTEIVRAVASPLFCGFTEEPEVLFSQGVLLDKGKMLLSLNNKEEHCVLISIEDCLIQDDPVRDYSSQYSFEKNSRFTVGCYETNETSFKIRVPTPLLLSPNVKYGLNLVFRYGEREQINQQYVPVRCTLQGEKKISFVNFADRRKDVWLVAELYQFTTDSDKSITDLEIICECCQLSDYLYIEGIEFQPLERVEHPVVVVEYEEILKAVVTLFCYRSTEELKLLLTRGVLLNGGKLWFSINEKEEHCLMLSIEDCLIRDDPNRDYSDGYSSEKDSRFVAGCYKTCMMKFKIRVTTPLFLSPHVTYGVNLIFQSKIEGMKQQYFPVMYKLLGETKTSMVNIADTREDGWLVAKLYRFTTEGDKSILDLEIVFEDCGLSGYFYIEGIEFQPLGRVEHPVVVAEYEEMLKAAATPLFHRSTEELKLLLTNGILLNGGKTLFCLNDKGQHIERIFIEACLDPDQGGRVEHLYNRVNSRFPGGRCYGYYYAFKARVRAEYLTPHISFKVNLVFRYKYEWDVNSYNPLKYKVDGEDETKVFIIYPCTHMREDGWFIVPLYHFTSQHKTADLQFEFEVRWVNLLVAGIEFQPSEGKVELPVFEEYQHIVEVASQSLFYTSLEELKQILSKGVYLNGYKTWFSLNEKGEHCHMISMNDFPSGYGYDCFSRFPAGLDKKNRKEFKTHVKTQFLSPSVTYTVNLVYKSYSWGEQVFLDLKYRLRGEATTSTVYLANKRREDDLYMAELYQFTSDGSVVDLEIIFENSGTSKFGLEGIMFQPLEMVEGHPESDPESDPAQNLLYDYEEVLNLSKESLMWTSKKELYTSLRSGFLINNGQQWFTIDKHGKKCPMLSARATWVIDDKNSACKSSHESRFGEVLVITAGDKFELLNEIKPEVLSADTLYASYFVYKLPQDQSTFEYPLKVNTKNGYHGDVWFVYLVSPPGTPIIGPKVDENRYNPLNRHKLSALPKQRSDGWMEVKVWQFETKKTRETVSMHLKLEYPDEKDLSGLIIHGIELRPI